MDDFVLAHIKKLYGIDSDTPHRAFQFPRLPPGITHPLFKIHNNPTKEQFLKNSSQISKRLEGFQKLYQQHASGLFSMNSAIIPPGHPLHSERNSVDYLKSENDKLMKQNIELKKKIEKQNKI